MNDRARQASEEHLVQVTTGQATLEGNLIVPAGARGLVLFAHGSGSSRHSPRNRYVAGVFQAGGLATLLIDLLTPAEERVDLRTAELRFDIDLLASRLAGAADWLNQQPDTHNLRIGCFGASTGGGAALLAAAQNPHLIEAVVSRGGRPDLAGPALPQVRAPTLLIVGERDYPVNRSSGEKAPVASSSRSHAERSESCNDGKRLAYAFKSAALSCGTIRSTRAPPYGAISGGVVDVIWQPSANVSEADTLCTFFQSITIITTRYPVGKLSGVAKP